MLGQDGSLLGYLSYESAFQLEAIPSIAMLCT
jgi:hypothetical protein